MNKKTWLIIVAMGLLFGIVATAFGADNTDTMVSVPKSMLSQGQLAEVDVQKRIERYGKWVGLGEEVGKAINGGLKAVTDQAVGLSNTRLGGFIMFLVAYKVIGQDLIQLFVGGFLLLVGLIIWLVAYIRYTRVLKPDLDGYGLRIFGWYAGAMVFIIMCMLIMFV